MHAAADRILADAGNACPANYEKITSKTQCKLAEDYQGREKDGTWPSGCYLCDGVEDCDDGTWFNEHSTGSANGGARPWCTAAQLSRTHTRMYTLFNHSLQKERESLLKYEPPKGQRKLMD